MIDIHNHILPGIDDGAKDLDESVTMARMAAADGIHAIMATPHHFLDNGVPPLEQAQRLRDSVLMASQAIIDLRVGQEIATDPSLPDWIASGRALPFESTRYILVEPPFFSYPTWVDEVFFHLQVMGFKPIIAHPERCSEVQKDLEIMVRLVERGVVSQVNAGSFLGHYGAEAQKTAERLLERNLAHVMSSDAHSATGFRLPLLSEAVDVVTRLAGQDKAQAMVTAVPQAIWEGRDVDIGPVLEPPKRRRLFGIF